MYNPIVEVRHIRVAAPVVYQEFRAPGVSFVELEDPSITVICDPAPSVDLQVVRERAKNPRDVRIGQKEGLIVAKFTDKITVATVKMFRDDLFKARRARVILPRFAALPSIVVTQEDLSELEPLSLRRVGHVARRLVRWAEHKW